MTAIVNATMLTRKFAAVTGIVGVDLDEDTLTSFDGDGTLHRRWQAAVTATCDRKAAASGSANSIGPHADI